MSSQLKVNAIRHTGASSDAITLASDGTATARITNRSSNLIINGSQIIDQRNGGTAVTATSSGLFPVDRFLVFEDTDGTLTAQQTTITDLANFTKCVRLTVGTADSSLAASQYYGLFYRVEAFDTSHLGWGTSNAKTVTLSFWARSSVAGDHSCAFRSNNGADTYQFKYTLAANTWTKITKTITGPTSGTFPANSNARAFDISWAMAGSSLASSTLNSWHTGVSYGLAASGAVNLMATAGATFDLTGVQLEIGDFASDYCHEPYSETLRKCQRYYQEIHGGYGGGADDSTEIVYCVTYPVKMRATPSVGQTAAMTFEEPSDADRNQSSIGVSIRSSRCSDTGCVVSLDNYSSIQKDQLYFSNCSQNSGGKVTYSAEL